MALLTVQSITSVGVIPVAPAQISVWASADTISASDIGSRGVIAEITNTSGGSLDVRVSDPGFTPSSNPAANGYTSFTVPTGGTGGRIFVGPGNVDPATGVAKIGASATNAAFTVRIVRY